MDVASVVHSEQGRGTVFRVYLPVTTEVPEEQNIPFTNFQQEPDLTVVTGIQGVAFPYRPDQELDADSTGSSSMSEPSDVQVLATGNGSTGNRIASSVLSHLWCRFHDLAV